MGPIDAKAAATGAKPGQPPRPELQHAGATMIALVVSDKGFVCEARIIGKFEPGADARALAAVKKWRFTPAKHNGQPVPVTIVAQVEFWRDPQSSDSELVMYAPETDASLATQTKEASSAFTAPRVLPLPPAPPQSPPARPVP